MNLELVGKLCEKCISEGEILLGTKWLKEHQGFIQPSNPTAYVDLEGFNKWKSNCSVLLNLLGELY